MSANASWGAPAPSGGAKNASWGLASNAGGTTGSSKRLNAFLLGSKYGGGAGGLTKSKQTGRLAAAVSTSALNNLATYQSYQRPAKSVLTSPVPEGPENDDEGNDQYTAPRPKLQLRQETLQSLGISIQRKHNIHGVAPRGVLKKSGSANALARANTLTNLKRVPTQIELSNGRVLKRNTSVTFNERVRCKRVASSSSLAEDPKQLWFQDNEMNKIRRNAKKIVQEAAQEELENGSVRPESDVFSLRGLERHLPAAKEESRNRKEDTWDVVLEAQEVYLEHTGDYCDSEKIESLTRNISMQSLKEAQERAQQDAMEAL